MAVHSVETFGRNPGPPRMADAFLWEHLSAPPVAPSPRMVIDRRSNPDVARVIDVTPTLESQDLVPAGMFNQWPLEVLLRIHKPFTGLVVLIDIATHHRRLPQNESLLQSVTACVAGLLGANDFGCRTTEEEFVMVCQGLEGAEAQRRLNYISEQLWEFQQRGYGTFSLLFSWGGIGAAERPLPEAIAGAIHRMNHLNRNRTTISKESVNYNRKLV